MKKLKLVVLTPLKDFQVERENMRIHKSYAFSFFQTVPFFSTIFIKVPLLYNSIIKVKSPLARLFFLRNTFSKKLYSTVYISLKKFQVFYTTFFFIKINVQPSREFCYVFSRFLQGFIPILLPVLPASTKTSISQDLMKDYTEYNKSKFKQNPCYLTFRKIF